MALTVGVANPGDWVKLYFLRRASQETFTYDYDFKRLRVKLS